MHQSIVPVVLTFSILLQLASAAVALRLIRLSGCCRPWMFIATAIVLMAVRRIVTLCALIDKAAFPPSALGAELVALAISVLMLIGLLLLGPTFRSIRAAQNEASRRADEERLLVRESRHHVKNDLQMLIALVRLQTGAMPQGPPRDLLVDLESRIRSIALLHEEIYAAGESARNLPEYLSRLSRSVVRAYGSADTPVDLRLRLVQMEAQRRDLLSCGLLVNEARTNAFKHAFPPGAVAHPRVVVESRHAGGRRVLEIRDNGVGMDASPPAGGSFGGTLIRSIGEGGGWKTTITSPAAQGADRAPGDGPGTSVVVEF